MSRIKWIDVLKGWGVILVVLGHSPISQNLLGYIFSFHMPLFFMISGYLFSYKKYSKYTQLIYAKAQSLLLPYLSFSVLSILILSVADFFGVNYLPSFGLNPSYFQELILAKRNYITYNSPLWFFPTLFLVEVMYYFLKRILRNDIILYVGIIIIGFWGYRNSQSQHWFWTFDIAPYYVVFFAVGEYFKRFNLKQRENISVQVVLGYIFAFFNFMLLFNPEIFKAVFYSFKYQWLLYLSSIVVAIFGIIPYGYLAKAIERHNLFSFLGRSSMYIFALHIPIMYTVTTAFRKFVLHANNIFIPNEYNALGISITVLTIAFTVPWIYLIDNYFPFLLGKKNYQTQ